MLWRLQVKVTHHPDHKILGIAASRGDVLFDLKREDGKVVIGDAVVMYVIVNRLVGTLMNASTGSAAGNQNTVADIFHIGGNLLLNRSEDSASAVINTRAVEDPM